MEKSKLNSETNFVNLKDDFLIKIDERLSSENLKQSTIYFNNIENIFENCFNEDFKIFHEDVLLNSSKQKVSLEEGDFFLSCLMDYFLDDYIENASTTLIRIEKLLSYIQNNDQENLLSYLGNNHEIYCFSKLNHHSKNEHLTLNKNEIDVFEKQAVFEKGSVFEMQSLDLTKIEDQQNFLNSFFEIKETLMEYYLLERKNYFKKLDFDSKLEKMVENKMLNKENFDFNKITF